MGDNRTVILHWTDTDNERVTEPMEFNGAGLCDLQAARLWRDAARERGCDYIVIFAGQPGLDELAGMLSEGRPLLSHPSAILLLPVEAA